MEQENGVLKSLLTTHNLSGGNEASSSSTWTIDICVLADGSFIWCVQQLDICNCTDCFSFLVVFSSHSLSKLPFGFSLFVLVNIYTYIYIYIFFPSMFSPVCSMIDHIVWFVFYLISTVSRKYISVRELWSSSKNSAAENDTSDHQWNRPLCIRGLFLAPALILE